MSIFNRLLIVLFCSFMLSACFHQPTDDENTQSKPFILFDASQTGENHHIWATDGTTEGTRPLLKQYTMKDTPGKDWMTTLNNKTLFLARPLKQSNGHGHNHMHVRAAGPQQGQEEAPKLMVTDGTTKGTKALFDTGTNPLETVSSPFHKVDNHLYFLGFDKVDRFSLYKTDSNRVEKVSANINQVLGLDALSNVRIKAFNNKLFLFTQVFANNRIYTFDTKKNTWKDVINTGNFTVGHPIQAITIDNEVFILTRGFGSPTANIYQVNTISQQAKLADSNFLAAGITPCYNNQLCGLEMGTKKEPNQMPTRYFKLRTINSDSVAQSVTLTLNEKLVSPSTMKSLHIMNNKLYVLMRPPMSTLHAVGLDGTLSKAVSVKDQSTNITDIAKRMQDTQVIQRHLTINGQAWLYAQSNQAQCTGVGYEPWVIDTKTQTAERLKDILNSTNETHLPKGSCISSFTQQTRPTIVNGKIVFIANGGGSGNAATGNELWVSDGTPEGTSILRDIAPGKKSGVLVQTGHHHH